MSLKRGAENNPEMEMEKALVERLEAAMVMEKALVERLEVAMAMEKALVERLEAVIANGATTSARKPDGDLPAATDPAILALRELVDGPLRRVVTAAERIGGKTIEATQTLEETFEVEKELLIKAKPTQPPNQLLVDLAKSLQTLSGALSSVIATCQASTQNSNQCKRILRFDSSGADLIHRFLTRVNPLDLR